MRVPISCSPLSKLLCWSFALTATNFCCTWKGWFASVLRGCFAVSFFSLVECKFHPQIQFRLIYFFARKLVTFCYCILECDTNNGGQSLPITITILCFVYILCANYICTIQNFLRYCPPGRAGLRVPSTSIIDHFIAELYLEPCRSPSFDMPVGGPYEPH